VQPLPPIPVVPGAFAAKLDDLRMDYSKCAVDDESMRFSPNLRKCLKSRSSATAMFAGEAINSTESRAVLHTALRAATRRRYPCRWRECRSRVHEVLDAMAAVLPMGCAPANTVRRHWKAVYRCGQYRHWRLRSRTGDGDTGAGKPYHDGPRVHFVSNVDGAHIADTLVGLDPETTLIVVASKTFTTIETMTNAATARDFIVSQLGEDAVAKHFAAVSTALDKVADFGLDEDPRFRFLGLGGRPLLALVSYRPTVDDCDRQRCIWRFSLSGARAMDEHFQNAPVAENLPMLLGLLGVWHRLICNHPSRAIIPYEQRLSRFPGLSAAARHGIQRQVCRDRRRGRFGLIRTDCLGRTGHQRSTCVLPAPASGQRRDPRGIHDRSQMAMKLHLAHQHQLLIANCLAQSEALMRGRTRAGGAGPADCRLVRPKLRRRGLPRTRHFPETGLRSPRL
jgi:glucose-6-phosphate isomerase